MGLMEEKGERTGLIRRLGGLLRALGLGAAGRRRTRGGASDGDAASEGSGSIPAHYVTSAPGPQNALDIFGGEWSSRLPGDLANLEAGSLQLFADPRVDWFIDRLGGVGGKAILELGPLEGGHTYMLERAGAASIVAVEANTRAYLKCLITKELLGLERVRFLCGDFIEYLAGTEERFDACLASGVLYHMTRPAELIRLVARVTDRICLWTQYFDPELPPGSSPLCERIRGSEDTVYEGFHHTLYTVAYEEEALGWDGFCGGPAPFRRLMSRTDILRCLEHFGLGEIQVAFDDPDHEGGPAFALTAFRT